LRDLSPVNIVDIIIAILIGLGQWLQLLGALVRREEEQP